MTATRNLENILNVAGSSDRFDRHELKCAAADSREAQRRRIRIQSGDVC
jgi:hypothetical protein